MSDNNHEQSEISNNFLNEYVLVHYMKFYCYEILIFQIVFNILPFM